MVAECGEEMTVFKRDLATVPEMNERDQLCITSKNNLDSPVTLPSAMASINCPNSSAETVDFPKVRDAFVNPPNNSLITLGHYNKSTTQEDIRATYFPAYQLAAVRESRPIATVSKYRTPDPALKISDSLASPSPRATKMPASRDIKPY